MWPGDKVSPLLVRGAVALTQVPRRRLAESLAEPLRAAYILPDLIAAE